MTWIDQPHRAARVAQPPAPAWVADGAPRRNRVLAAHMDGVFAFLLFTAMLFSLQLGTIGAVLQAMLIPSYAIFRRRHLWTNLTQRWVLLAVPALAMASVFWSEAPRESAKFALEFALTVLGAVLIGASPRSRSVFRGLFLAFLLYVLVAVLFGHSTLVGADGGAAFSGLSDGKNLLADIAATGVILSLGVALTSLRGDRAWWAFAGLCAAGVELYAVVAAHSAGAMLGLAFGLAALVGLAAVHRTGMALRAVLVGFLTLCGVVGVGGFQWLSAQMIGLGANLFAKDTTLTGRTYLWYRADALIHEKPMLGRGFYAFWLPGNIDAEGLWRYAGITSRGGFTFHNTPVEILVQLGWVGLTVIVAILLIALAVVLVRFVRRPSLSLCVWLGLLVYELARTPIEFVGLTPFYFSTVLTFAALAVAFGARGSGSNRPPEAPPPPPQRAILLAPDRRLLSPTPAAPRRLLSAQPRRDL